MDRQLMILKGVVSHPRYFLYVIFLFMVFNLIVPAAFGNNGQASIENERKLITSGKRNKQDIARYIKSIKDKKHIGSAEDPINKWLRSDRGRNTKYDAEKKFAYTLHSAKKELEEMVGKSIKSKPSPEKISALIALGDRIKNADSELLSKFNETQQQLLDKRLPEIILKRHQQMLENYLKNIRPLLADFDKLRQLFREEAWGSAAELIPVIKQQLDAYQSIKAPPLLNSDTPYGIRFTQAPVIQLDEKQEIQYAQPSQMSERKIIPLLDKKKSVDIKAEADSGIVILPAVTGPPAAEDLDPTIDVQITQEIIDLAASLDNSPLKIYNYIKNNFDFDPYLGSRKGSVETLHQKSGNDYDQSSLLIALLRAAGIPSRYVRGIVELPVDRVKEWLGVDDGSTAGSILTTVGMEGVNIVDGGGEVVSIRFRHVWVEAYIPYGNYRGTPVDETGKMWVPMDPSFKGYSYQAGVNILTEMGFNAETFINDYITTFHESSPVEMLIQQIIDFLVINHPELSYEDIIRYKNIIVENHSFIPGSLPFLIRSIDSDFAQIPEDKRYKIRFHLYNGGTTFIDYTSNLPEIAGKRVTISYIPATQEDQDVIDSYGDLYDTPPHIINLKPVLKIDGNDVAISTASIGMGMTHSSDMHFTTPTGDSNQMPVVSNSIIAGTYQAIGIDTGKINPDIFLPAANEGTPDNDTITGGKLWKTAMGYLYRVERYDAELEKTMQMVVTKDVSEAIVENTIVVTYLFGTPQTFEWSGLVVDADRCIIGPFAINGDSSKKKQFMVISGADGSISENRIFEDEYDEEAVSTIKILELSSDMGIPIYTFNGGNIGTIYSALNLSSTVESAIYNAVAGGHEVTIPRDNITYFEWYGTGYIDMDTSSGAAGYIISGGHSGGATVETWTSWKMTWFTIFRDLCDTNPITASITFPPANSYFPALGWLDAIVNNQLRFDVTYTICYEGSGTKTVNETYNSYKAHPPGNYTFSAGYGTGATRNFTIFGVEIEIPDGENAINGCDSITLETRFIPSAPPSPAYQWEKGFCLIGCGDGTLTPANAPSTKFQGTIPGKVIAKLKATNTYGTTKAEKNLKVIGIGAIEAKDSTNTSNSIFDNNKGIESPIRTIKVAQKDTGTVDITVTPDPGSTPEGILPAGWKIEKISGTLNFDGAPGKLSARVKKDTPGDMVIRVTPCPGSTEHFQIKISVIGIKELEAKDSDNAANLVKDTDKTIEPQIKTIYVARKDTGNVDIKVTPEPSEIIELNLPTDWKIEKISGTLNFDGAPGKLTAKIKKDTLGEIIVKVTAESGSTYHYQLKICVVGVKEIEAKDSDHASNVIKDNDKAVEADIQTIFVAQKATGTVDIKVTQEPVGIIEANLPTGWKIEKVSGTLNFDGIPDKLTAKIKKDTLGEIIVRILPDTGSTDHFQIKICIIKIEFSAAPTGAGGNVYGYDIIDAANKDDDHISVEKNSDTWINVKITGAADAEKIFFKSLDDTTAMAAKPAATPAAGFLLKVSGKNKDQNQTTIEARLGSDTGPSAGSFFVNVYKEKSISTLTVYRVTDSNSAGTSPLTAISDAALETFCNGIVKKGVIKFDNVDVVDKNIHYDLNANGSLEYYYDGGTQPELSVIQGAGLTGNPKVAVIKNFSFGWRSTLAAAAGQKKITLQGVSYLASWTARTFQFGSGANTENVQIQSISGNELTLTANLTHAHPVGTSLVGTFAAGVSSDPQVVQDGATINTTLLHETLHRGDVANLLDVISLKNIMHHETGLNHDELRFMPLTKNYGGGTENQWETIPR